MAVAAQLPPVKERYELKYLVPWDLVEPLSRFIEPYCAMDAFSDSSADGFYVVNSLYFDTRGYEFLKQRLWGRDTRFNMRVRSYGAGDQPPYFMEIKHKTGTCVKKYRTTIGGEEWPRILTDPCYRIPETEVLVERRNKELFMMLAHSYAIEPKILTRYRRRAFFSTVDAYARLTMDADMQYQTEEDYNLQPGEHMVNYDNETVYSSYERTDARVVLELKCDVGQVPMWMLDLITRFELKQVGFSKYLSSTLVSFYDNGNGYMGSASQGYAMHGSFD